MLISALPPHSASLSPSDCSSLGASSYQGVQATFPKVFSSIPLPLSSGRFGCFFSSMAIQLEGW